MFVKIGFNLKYITYSLKNSKFKLFIVHLILKAIILHE
jgi:hypothetical protein